MAEIKRVFLNVSMVNRTDGLREIAKRGGVTLAEMEPGDYIFFVNSNRDKIAALVGPQRQDQSDVIAYTRLGRGQNLDMRAITNIPRYFDGRSLNYDKALSSAIEKSLVQKGNGMIESY